MPQKQAVIRKSSTNNWVPITLFVVAILSIVIAYGVIGARVTSSERELSESVHALRVDVEQLKLQVK